MYAQLKLLVCHTPASLPHSCQQRDPEPSVGYRTAQLKVWVPPPAALHQTAAAAPYFSNTSHRASKTVRRIKMGIMRRTKVGEETGASLCTWAHATTAGVQFIRGCCGLRLHEFTLNSRCQQRVFNQAKPLLTCHQLHCTLNTAPSKNYFSIYTHTHTHNAYFSLCSLLLQ